MYVVMMTILSQYCVEASVRDKSHQPNTPYKLLICSGTPTKWQTDRQIERNLPLTKLQTALRSTGVHIL